MGQLHGRRAADGIAVEGEQAVASVLAEHRVEVVGADAALLQLGPAHPAAGVLVVLAHADQAEEDPPGRLPARSSNDL